MSTKNQKNNGEEVVSNTKGMDDTNRSISSQKEPQYNKKIWKKYQGTFLTDKIFTGGFKYYSMCMVCEGKKPLKTI